jgi:hypothetical protein
MSQLKDFIYPFLNGLSDSLDPASDYTKSQATALYSLLCEKKRARYVRRNMGRWMATE